MSSPKICRLHSIYHEYFSRHRTDKSLRTDNKSFIVLKNPNHNNRQSLIRRLLEHSEIHFWHLWHLKKLKIRSLVSLFEARQRRFGRTKNSLHTCRTQLMTNISQNKQLLAWWARTLIEAIQFQAMLLRRDISSVKWDFGCCYIFLG